MVQRYLPEIVRGDKRVARHRRRADSLRRLARIPQGNEIRGNLAVGGKGVAQPIYRPAIQRDRRRHPATLAWRRAACC